MAGDGTGTVELAPEYIADTRGRVASIPSVVFAVAVPMFVASRFWARFLASRKAFIDDWLLLVATIFCVGSNIIFIVMVQNGFGHHVDAIPEVGNAPVVFLLYWLVQQVYKISLHTVKISLVLFYWRLFNTIRWFKWGSMALMIIIVIYTLVTVLIGFFQCTPVSKAWIREKEGTCIDLTPFWTSNAGFSISTDFIILLMPIPLLLKLQIPTGQKLGLIPVFGLGAFVTAVSIVRLEPLRRAGASKDITYDLEGTMWTILELNLAILCASLPWTWILLTRLFPSVFGRSKLSTPRSTRLVSLSKNGNPWARADAKYGPGTVMGDYSGNRSGSEEAIAPKGGIQKTVDYTVEYSRDKNHSTHSGGFSIV